MNCTVKCGNVMHKTTTRRDMAVSLLLVVLLVVGVCDSVEEDAQTIRNKRMLRYSNPHYGTVPNSNYTTVPDSTVPESTVPNSTVPNSTVTTVPSPRDVTVHSGTMPARCPIHGRGLFEEPLPLPQSKDTRLTSSGGRRLGGSNVRSFANRDATNALTARDSSSSALTSRRSSSRGRKMHSVNGNVHGFANTSTGRNSRGHNIHSLYGNVHGFG
eukprot:Lankesteria_metandrocarpae@DN8421_c0_g1_i1.p1